MPTSLNRSKQSTNKKPILILSLLALAALISALVWYVYNRNENLSSSTTTNQSPNISTNTTPQQPATPTNQSPTDTHIFKIPELGIQMTLPEGLEGLEHRVTKTIDNNPKILFGTTELNQKNNKDSYCTTDNAPLGYLVRYNKDPKSDIQASGPAMTKSFKSHYFAYYHPSQGCTADQDLGNMQDMQTKLLQDAFNSLVVTE